MPTLESAAPTDQTPLNSIKLMPMNKCMARPGPGGRPGNLILTWMFFLPSFIYLFILFYLFICL